MSLLDLSAFLISHRVKGMSDSAGEEMAAFMVFSLSCPNNWSLLIVDGGN